MATDEDKSSIEPLNPPEFKGTIPPLMLAKMTDIDSYLFGRVSEMEEREKWLVSACKQNRAYLIKVDTIARSTSRWRHNVTSKWSLIAGFILLLLPVVVKTAVEIWLRK